MIWKLFLPVSEAACRGVSVEWLALKPDWLLSRRLFCVRKLETCLKNGILICCFLQVLDRIKQTGSMVIGKDEFGDLCH